MDCTNCGGPLPPKSNVCGYCSTLNDTDLRAIQRNVKKVAESDRRCPRCGVLMKSIDLKIRGIFLVERCESCMGIFFDPGELETLLDASVSHVYEVDHARLQKLLEQEVQTDRPVMYLPCPACGELMNRKNFGARSGVVVDRCRHHGVWLDGGELGTLLKWTKAGGRMHAEHHAAAAERDEERIRQLKLLRLNDPGPEFKSEPGYDVARLIGALKAFTRLFR